MPFDEMIEIFGAKFDQLNLNSRQRKSGVVFMAEVAPTTEANAANAPARFKPKGSKGRGSSKDAGRTDDC